MKISILNKYDRQGGAAIGAFRLHSALSGAGAHVDMIVDMKTCDAPSVHGPESLTGMFIARNSFHMDELPLKFYNRQKTVFHTAWFPRRMPFKLLKNTDVIIFHWIAGGFMSVGNMRSIASLGKPIIWKLSDMWAFTGGCHYAGSCEKYKSQCGACPQLGSSRSRDLSSWVFRRKKRAYSKLDLHIVSPSVWLGGCARESALFSERPVHVIPNGLDTNVFKPIEKETARSIFNLPKDRKIILFGADGGTRDERKGFRYLVEAMDRLKSTADYRDCLLLIFGSGHTKGGDSFPFETVFAGSLSDEVSMALIYSCADVFVLPSLEDNLPNTVMESMACGTPVVAFHIGGVPDMVEHMKNGYLAKFRDSEDLAHGIKWALENEPRRRGLGEAAREKALREYTMDMQAKRYLNLYNKIAGGSKKEA